MMFSAAVVRSPGEQFEVVELERDELGPDQVLVRVVATGMCQTDVHVRAGGLYPVPFPAVLGHECAGVVEDAGASVSSLRIGDSVVVTFEWCGHCRACTRGAMSYCDQLMARNYLEPASYGRETGRPATTNQPGVNLSFFGQSSFSDLVVCNARSAIRVDVAPENGLGALGPLACSVQTGAGAVAVAADLVEGETVAIYGAGAVGLSAVMMAAARGAGQIAVVEPNAERRELAVELGADVALDPTKTDAPRTIRRSSGGGVDVVVDCTGIASVVNAGLKSLRTLGRYYLVGALAPPASLELDGGWLYGRSIAGLTQGSSSPPDFIPELVRLWREGRMPIERLTQEYALSRIEAAADDMASGRVVKPLIVPDPTNPQPIGAPT